MDVPGTVRDALDGESVVATVELGGENALFVTSTRTIYFRADGLLSDESFDEYLHNAIRVNVSEGRRKATITLVYGPDDERSFSVPSEALDSALHPVLAGVLSANGVTGPGETILRTDRFSELTLVVTTEQLIKHVGNTTWDTDYETVPYSDVRGLDMEDGAVATQLVIETDSRVQRVKVPTEAARGVHESLESALFGYHDVDSYRDFKRESESAGDANADVEPEPESTPRSDSASAFDSPDLDPIEPTGPEAPAPSDPGAPGVTDEPSDAADESNTDSPEPTQSEQAPDVEVLAERIEELEATLARQEDLLAKQRAALGELAAEVRSTRDQ